MDRKSGHVAIDFEDLVDGRGARHSKACTTGRASCRSRAYRHVGSPIGFTGKSVAGLEGSCRLLWLFGHRSSGRGVWSSCSAVGATVGSILLGRGALQRPAVKQALTFCWSGAGPDADGQVDARYSQEAFSRGLGGGAGMSCIEVVRFSSVLGGAGRSSRDSRYWKGRVGASGCRSRALVRG